MSQPNATFRFIALLGAAVVLSVPTAVTAQTVAPDEPSQNRILVPRPDFPGAKQQEEPQTDLGNAPRRDFPGPKQNDTPSQTQDPSEK
jgi:hypothetical protein